MGGNSRPPKVTLNARQASGKLGAGNLGGESWGHPQTLAAAVTRCCHRRTPRMLMSNELRACAGRNHGIGRQRAAVNSDGIQGQSSASKTAGSVR